MGLVKFVRGNQILLNTFKKGNLINNIMLKTLCQKFVFKILLEESSVKILFCQKIFFPRKYIRIMLLRSEMHLPNIVYYI